MHPGLTAVPLGSAGGTVADMAKLAAIVKPRLRGWFHQVAFFVAIPAAAVLIVSARPGKAKVAAVIYGVAICALFGVSSTYHRWGWGEVARRRMKRADHGTIFVMIAGSYTPVCLVVLHGALGISLLVAVWIGAITGLVLAITGIAERPGVGFSLYLTLGWLALIGLPQLISRGTTMQVALLITGGVVYTLGSIVLGLKRPDPFPKTFGYHEVWHTMVIAASTCHYIMILSLLRSA
jgi:hemolysin III